jgi:hypothetical protein
MRAMRLIALQLVFCLAVVAAGAAEKADPFPVGEKLTYRVKFKGLSAGEATMRVVSEEEFDGRKAVRFEMLTKSGRLVSVFFEVDHVSGSVVDLESGGTLHFASDKKNGERREFEEFTVNPETETVLSFTRNWKGEEKVVENPCPGPVLDMVGFFYHLRTRELTLGEHTLVTAFQGHKEYPLRLGVDGLETLKLRKLGTFWAYVVHPSAAMPGLFSDEGDATVWFEQTTHTLLKMLVNTPSGVAKMYLIKAEKSPLMSAPGAVRKR